MRLRQPIPDAILLEINHEATRWHAAMCALSYHQLEYEFQREARVLQAADDALERLWDRRRQWLAMGDSDRFQDVIGGQAESVFENPVSPHQEKTLTRKS